MKSFVRFVTVIVLLAALAGMATAQTILEAAPRGDLTTSAWWGTADRIAVPAWTAL